MKITALRICAAVSAAGLAVCAAAAVRPDIFGVAEKEAQPVSAPAETADPIEKFVIEREQLRSIQLTELDEMIDSEKTTGDMRDMACAEKIEVLRRYENEQSVAGILNARGMGRCAVCDDGACITVITDKEELSASDASLIKELVISQTGAEAADIKIIPIK